MLFRSDKIVGPGNIFVATAKKICYGMVDIDMIAGPSEVLVIADEKANPKYIAADLMAQAEHDKLASAILVTTSESLVQKVDEELEKQVQSLERREIIVPYNTWPGRKRAPRRPRPFASAPRGSPPP